MITPLTTEFALLAIAVMAGLSVITYEGVAEQKGWPVGEWFSGPISTLQAVAWFCVIAGLITCFVFGRWWHALIALMAGIVLTRSLLKLLGPRTQLLAGVVVLPAAAVIVWLWVR